jgi:hypothetical protein
MGRLGIPVFLAFLVVVFVDLAMHDVVNINLFRDHPEIWRHADMRTYVARYLANLVFAVMFCLVYAKGYEGGGALEGLRFGGWMALLVCLPQVLMGYAHYMVSRRWATGEFVVGAVTCLAAGLVVGAAYKGPVVRRVTT